MKKLLILALLVAFAAPAHAEKLCTLKKGATVAVSSAALDKAYSFATSGDKVAFNKLYDAGLAAITSGPEQVYLGTGGGFTKARVRKPGGTTYFWTLPEMLECP